MTEIAKPTMVSGISMVPVMTAASGKIWITKSNEYKKWVASDAHEKWKDDHDLRKADCPRVMKLDCIGHVQKRAGTALRELRKKTAGKLKDGLPIGGRKCKERKLYFLC